MIAGQSFGGAVGETPICPSSGCGELINLPRFEVELRIEFTCIVVLIYLATML